MRDKDGFLTGEEAKRIVSDLYERGHGIAEYVIEKHLGSQLTPEERDDLVQDGFLRMIIHAEHLHGRTSEEQLRYLVSTMRNIAIDEGRRRSQRKLLESVEEADFSAIASSEMTPEEQCIMAADSEEKCRRLEAVLARLPKRDRCLLVEKYQNNRSDQEISSLLGIKPSCVRVYLSRARHKAEIYYGEEIDEEQNQRSGSEKQS